MTDRVRQRLLGDPEQRVRDLRVRHHRAAGRHQMRVDHPGAVRPRELQLQRFLERASFERGGRQPEHAAPSLLEDGLGRRPSFGERRGRFVGMSVGDRALGGAELQQHRDQPLRERVVDLTCHPVALRRGGLGPSVRLRRLVQPCVGDRDRRVLREQLQQLGVLVDERAARIAGEHHQGADDLAAPPDRDADHALERLAVLGTNVTAGDVGVVLEDHRPSPGDQRARRPLREREHLARLAGDPDVGLLAIDPGRLIHQADGARVASQQFRRALEDAFQQWAERELTGQVLDDGGERRGPSPICVGDHDQRCPFREGSPVGHPRSFPANGQSDDHACGGTSTVAETTRPSRPRATVLDLASKGL